jgi:hypothetical protein
VAPCLPPNGYDRASSKIGERRSLRKIAAELAEAGHPNERGLLFIQEHQGNGRRPNVGQDRRLSNRPRKALAAERGPHPATAPGGTMAKAALSLTREEITAPGAAGPRNRARID